MHLVMEFLRMVLQSLSTALTTDEVFYSVSPLTPTCPDHLLPKGDFWGTDQDR